MNVFITGGTGLIGQRLAQKLTQRGHRLFVLSRKAIQKHPLNVVTIRGNPTTEGDWLEQLDTCDAVIHLAGENIFARRWTRSFMNEIVRSRVDSTRLIAERMARKPFREDGTPRVLLSASAIGYYGPGEESKNESAPPGHDFMAEVCVAWEAAAGAAKQAGVRMVHPRFGIVLDPDGGALPTMMRPFRWFVGGRVGDGQQWVSWIHRDDATAALLHLVENNLSGPFNLTSPQPVRNREFCATLARVMHRPNWLPVPRLAIRLALGKVADVVAAGQSSVPDALIQSGFTFQSPALEPALRQLLSKDDRGST